MNALETFTAWPDEVRMAVSRSFEHFVREHELSVLSDGADYHGSMLWQFCKPLHVDGSVYLVLRFAITPSGRDFQSPEITFTIGGSREYSDVSLINDETPLDDARPYLEALNQENLARIVKSAAARFEAILSLGDEYPSSMVPNLWGRRMLPEGLKR